MNCTTKLSIVFASTVENIYHYFRIKCEIDTIKKPNWVIHCNTWEIPIASPNLTKHNRENNK
jgi:hypothetical protein